MNMHPGDLRSIEEQRGADSAQKEETSLIDPPHVSEMTKTLIHIEAGGSFLVGEDEGGAPLGHYWYKVPLL